MKSDSQPAPVPAMPRRDFLKSSAGYALGAAIAAPALSAAVQRRAIGANDRIRIGMIGCGERGRTAHMEGIRPHFESMNVEIVALADPWRQNREKAAGMVKEWTGRDVKQFTSHRDLLQLKEVDAVMIASPDHHHTTHLEAAAKAGRHAYVEKPLSNDLKSLVRAVDAVKEAGTIVQCGTQLRSLPSVVGARNVVQSGLLGKINRVEECRNAEKPYWYGYLGREVTAADVDWNEFQGDTPKQAFDPRKVAAWYGYYEFSQGPVPQWGAHFLDMAHFITGCGLPTSCMCMGGTMTWKDENKFTAPDCVQATWMYPDGFMLSSSNNFGNGSGSSRKFFGDKGTLDIENWNDPTYSAEGAPRRDGSIRGKKNVVPVERPDHFLNWLQCLRSGETPHASIDAGYQHAIAVVMATMSFDSGKRAVYDHASRTIKLA